MRLSINSTNDFKNSYAYDAWGRLSSLIQQSVTSGNAVAGKRADFAYNAANQLEKIGRYEGTTTAELAINTFYDYDLAGRLKTLLHTMDGTLPGSGWGTDPVAGYQFTYDYASNIYSIDSYIDGYLSYSYDAQNQLTYDGSNYHSYDDNGNRSGNTTGTNNQLLSDGTYNYEYDDEGNRTRKTEIYTGLITDYLYDHRNRLVEVLDAVPDTNTEGWGNTMGYSGGFTFVLNANGAGAGGEVVLTILSGSNYPAGASYSVVDYSAELGVDYVLDRDNPTTDSGSVPIPIFGTARIPFYTFRNGPTEATESFEIHVSVNGGSTVVLEADIYDLEVTQSVTYTYDVLNQLVRREFDADGDDVGAATDTFYSHLNDQIALQFDGDAASDLSHRYFWGPVVDQLLADEQVSSLGSAGSYLWPLADQVGTIRDLATHNSSTDETTVANHRLYDAFGNLVSETNDAVDEIFGFTGLLWDEIAKLQNSRARNYDPATGRFLTEDPIGFGGGDTNLNRYVGNSPTMYTDPSGLMQSGLAGRTGRNSGTRGASSLGIFLQDYLYYLNPFQGDAKKDTFSKVMVGGKVLGWTAFYVCGGAAVGLQAAGAAGLIGGAGRIFIGSTIPAGGSGLLIGGGSIAAGGATAGATTAVNAISVAEGGSLIGWLYQGQIVVSAPITSHAALGTQAGLVVNGQPIAGAVAFTVCKMNGQVAVLGSQNFGGMSAVAPVANVIEKHFK